MDYSIKPSLTRELSPLINFTDSGYIPDTYTPPAAISSTHNQPRFGYTNDLGALIEDGNDQQKEYVLGIIIGAIIIFCVALLWFLVIVILKILGQKKVGFFGGRFVRPGIQPEGGDGNEEKGGVEVVMAPGGRDQDHEISEAVPADSTYDNAVDDKTEKRFATTVWTVRVLFVLSGIFVIISGGLFYGKGVVSFKNSIDEVRNGIDLVQSAAYKSIKLTDDVIQSQSNLEQEMEPTEEVVADQICGLDEEKTEQLRSLYDAFVTKFDQLSAAIDGSLMDFNHDLRSLVALTEEIDSGLDAADAFFYVLIALSIIIIGLIVAMLVGVFFAWKDISNCFTKCIQYAIIWPLFVFFLILSWIFALLFLIFSLAGADFCVSPDQHVENLLTRNEDMFDGVIFGFVTYYVTGCKVAPQGAQQVKEIAGDARELLVYGHALTELLGQLPIDNIATICGLGTQEVEALSALIAILHDTSHALNRGVVGLREVLACETFNPIYTTFVHQAFCVQGVSGLTYIFSTTLVISIFSMVMIMLRAALYPIKEPNAKPASRSENDNYNENSPGNGNQKEKAVVF
mmetsp:Transcript_10148/g.21980  ORF Transcript_10148/g.21980 Transcript_10148/m.21980 type:complete len:571 (+) Transcript_10148:153-1865(+)|eukprot:CAMPEP_0183724590 /NCGR_PEP_ID=MMETSP0737-20130205/18025_1 /TAXON_ID=385413 /ORGANISM="Thalassiosira miniscula, Strain CCMP1093" /LENGTH=570 /DNA_ID=CAMNT_0025955215 /DNA_START=33 /DNA_END=1745 /DNA_ORIENTATION=-